VAGKRSVCYYIVGWLAWMCVRNRYYKWLEDINKIMLAKSNENFIILSVSYYWNFDPQYHQHHPNVTAVFLSLFWCNNHETVY
jgi:hypothetical protein